MDVNGKILKRKQLFDRKQYLNTIHFKPRVYLLVLRNT